MKFKTKSKTLLFALCGLLLVGCGEADATTYEDVSINDVLASLRTGFTLTGSVSVAISYYEDSDYTIPYETTLASTTTYTYTLVYQNDDDYVGVDRRFYEEVDGESVYLFGENSFDYNGYVGIRYLDYDNTLQTTYGVDSDGELSIYALNGLMNPFEIVSRNDFTQTTNTTFALSTTKASVFYGEIFSVLDDYVDAVSFKTADFTFENDTLTEAHFVSYNVDSLSPTTLQSESYTNVYPRYNYTADLYFSEIGTSSAQDLIKVEEEKEENEPLAEALEVMKNSTGFTYRRRSTPYIDGEYAGTDQVISIYYSADGLDSKPYVYSQAYYLSDPNAETYDPTEATTSDFLLYSPYSTVSPLYVYQLDSTTAGSTNTFARNSSGFSHLEDYYTYNYLFSAMNFASYMNANIFNINEDGSYSPTLDNLQYIAGECFLANIDGYDNIESGYVTDVRIYVEESDTYDSYVFDEIVVEYNQSNSYTGQVVFNFYDFNNSKPAFDFGIE